MIPERLRYTGDHEWAQLDEADVVRVGITHYAQQQLGDVVFIQLPELHQLVHAGDVIAEVESTKSVSEVYAPVSGTVIAINSALADAPELINTEPYGGGWMVEIKVDDAAALDGLLDATAYRALTT